MFFLLLLLKTHFCIKNIAPVLCSWSLALIDSVPTHNICSGQYHITWFPPLYRRVTPTITREKVCNTFKRNTFTEKIIGFCCEFQNMHGCVVSFLELNRSSRKKKEISINLPVQIVSLFFCSLCYFFMIYVFVTDKRNIL